MQAQPHFPNCPLDYVYSPDALARVAERTTHVLYVVGGLYGNPQALAALNEILQQEPDAQVIFNGDFNWFNIDAQTYADINEFALRHPTLRGNVETELGQQQPRGCGCAYPDWVDVKTVDHSNEIIEALRKTANLHPLLTARFAHLPRFLVYRIGSLRVGVVHGDAQSLAGWGFAQEHLARPEHLDTVKSWFRISNMDVYASTHTCLPVLQRLDLNKRSVWIVNNGAAGMPNFFNTQYGLVTRLATRPYHSEPVYSATYAGLHLDAIALHYDHTAWADGFLKNWPSGTAAYASYYDRILNGPDYRIHQAIRF